MTGAAHDLGGIVGSGAAGSGTSGAMSAGKAESSGADGGVPHGRLLTAFAEAVLGSDASHRDTARREVRAALGDAAFVDACAVIASFDAVVKIADGTGIPLEDWKAERTSDIREALGIDAMRRVG